MAKKKKTSGVLGAVMTALLALAQLYGKIPGPWLIWVALPVIGVMLLYALSDWFTKQSLTGVEKYARFVVLFAVLCPALLAFGCWLYPQAFYVEIETMILATPNHGTGYWVASPMPSGCSVSPAHVVYFIAVTNLQSHRSLVSSFKLEMGGREIPRLETRNASVFFIPDANANPNFSCAVGRTVDFQSPTGIGSLANFALDTADLTRSCRVVGSLLDQQLGSDYVAPEQTIRGWIFLRGPEPYIPHGLTATITDASGKAFRVDAIQRPEGNPNADLLSRKLTIDQQQNLSECTKAVP